MEGRARPTRGRGRPLASISIDSVDPTNISPGGVPPADLPANTHSQPRPDTYLLTLEPAELKLRSQEVLPAAGSEPTSSGLAQDRAWGTIRLLQCALELTEELSHPPPLHLYQYSQSPSMPWSCRSLTPSVWFSQVGFALSTSIVNAVPLEACW